MSDSTPIAAARDALANLGDDQIHAAIHALVHGLVRGGLGDLVRRADQIIDDVVDSIVEQLATLGGPPVDVPALVSTNPQDWTHVTPGRAAGPYGAPEVFAPTTAAPEPEAAPHRLQDAVKHTCVICGREGTRRYVQGSIGWRCAATATACPGNRKPLPSDFRPKAIQADVTPAARAVPEPVATPPRAAQGATPVTARCGGCPRTWNLTGRVLTAAVSFHEHQHEGHMVEVVPGVDA